MANENPISRAMIEHAVWNKFEYYLPAIARADHGYTIFARLPDQYYQKWYKHIASKERFRQMVLEKIALVVKPFLNSQGARQYLNLIWLASGLYFQCQGDDCSIGVDDKRHTYSPHNIDTSIQATILFLALSVYLPELYFVMEELESGKMEIEDWPIDEKIFSFPHLADVIRSEN